MTNNVCQTIMGEFRFKKFTVVNERSAMKVNTDGVLLGAAMTLKEGDKRLLDVGTGTGTIALMAAQRLAGLSAGYAIDAIDIDEPSACEAAQNFAASPWHGCLHAHHMSLNEFAETCGRYDVIFSNPPYFDESLLAPEERRSNARHTSTGLSYRELLDFASERLTTDGRISMVLPADLERPLCRHARMNGLHLFRIVHIRTVPRKAPSRIIAEFSRQRCDSPSEELLTIQDEGKYTQEYLSLTHEFYLFA